MGEVACGGEHHREGGQCSGQRDHHLHCNGRFDGQDKPDRIKQVSVSHQTQDSPIKDFARMICLKFLTKVPGNLWGKKSLLQ